MDITHFSYNLYNIIIDPMLVNLRKVINCHVPSESKLIDIACGTGAQAFQLAGKCKIVVGVDLNESLIHFADKKRKKQNIQNLSFIRADANDLYQFSDKEFDYSLLCLALHQFPQNLHKQILKKAMRISSKLIITDYACPQPGNMYGRFIKIIEYLAGGDHYKSFKDYLTAGGLEKIAVEAGLRIIHSRTISKGIFRLGVFEDVNILSD